jgi:ABC-2 type transport system permease protein
MNRIWIQCRKELAQFRRDRLTIMLALALPLVYLLIYGYAMRLESKEIPLIVQDFNNSPISRAYVEQVIATNRFKIMHGLASPSIVDEAIDRNLANAVIVIPPDFERRIKAGKTSNVQLLIDGIDVNNARVVAITIRAATEFFLSRIDNQITNDSINTYIRLWFNPGRKEALFFVSGAYGVILWVYPSLFAALAMNREKEQGTIVQVYASGISAHEFILGKGLAYLIIAVGQAIFLMFLGSLIFGIRLQGHLAPLIAGTLLYLSNSILFGLFFGISSESQGEAAQKVLGIGYLSSVLLSGFIYPLNNLPLPLSILSRFIPTRYYIDITRDAFIRGTGWRSIGSIPLFLILIGLLLFFISWFKLRRMQLKD